MNETARIHPPVVLKSRPCALFALDRALSSMERVSVDHLMMVSNRHSQTALYIFGVFIQGMYTPFIEIESSVGLRGKLLNSL